MAENTPPPAPTIEEQIATLTAALEKQKTISEDQSKIIVALQGDKVAEKVALPAKPVIPKGTVKVGKKEYKFALAQFFFENKKVLAEDAAIDKELLEKIVALPGQNVLKEQV